MAGPSPNKNELVLGLTPSEAKVLILSILCNNDGKVDFNLLAQKGGYKTKDSANVVFGNARRKLLRLHGENSTASTTGEPSAFMTPATDAAGAKGKNLGGTEGEDGASLSGPGPATPTSKKATPKRKKAAAADTEETTGDSLPTDGQWNNLDETPTPTPKRQRKKGTAVKVATPKKTAKSPKVKSEETVKEDPEEKVDDTCPQTDLKMDTEDRALSLDIERFVNREKD